MDVEGNENNCNNAIDMMDVDCDQKKSNNARNPVTPCEIQFLNGSSITLPSDVSYPVAVVSAARHMNVLAGNVQLVDLKSEQEITEDYLKKLTSFPSKVQCLVQIDVQHSSDFYLSSLVLHRRAQDINGVKDCKEALGELFIRNEYKKAMLRTIGQIVDENEIIQVQQIHDHNHKKSPLSVSTAASSSAEASPRSNFLYPAQSLEWLVQYTELQFFHMEMCDQISANGAALVPDPNACSEEQFLKLIDQLLEVQSSIPNKGRLDKGKISPIDVLTNDHRNNYSLLSIAAERGFSKAVQVLIEAGSFIEHRTNTGATPLGLAVRGSFLETSRILLEAGANVDSVDLRGYSILMRGAAHTRGLDIITLLIESNANLYVKNYLGDSVLCLSGGLGRLEILQLLLDGEERARQLGLLKKWKIQTDENGNYPSLIDIAGYNGNTPLVRASMSCVPELVYFLLKNNADVTIQNADGISALGFAIKVGSYRIIQMILNQVRDRPDILETLLTQKSNHGDTLLMMAVVKGRKNIINRLIKLGCDIHQIDTSGRSAAQLADLCGKKNIIDIFKKLSIRNNKEKVDKLFKSTKSIKAGLKSINQKRRKSNGNVSVKKSQIKEK